MRGHILVLFFCLYTADGFAQSIKPSLGGKQLSIAIEGVNYPENIIKNLKSGLTTKIQIIVNVNSEGRRISPIQYSILAFYDLWDDLFQINWLRGDVKILSQKINKMTDALKTISRFRLTNIVSAELMSKNQPTTIELRLTVNPLEKEKILEIRKWVSQNSVSVPGQNPGGTTTSSNNASNRLGGLFSQVFENYTAEDGTTGSWSQSLSTTFKVESLPIEKL